MKVIIGSDHAGFAAKVEVKSYLSSRGHEVLDAGPSSDERCDYPDFASIVAQAVSRNECPRGVLICGTGIGMSITANKFKGVRAALCHSPDTARMSRAHNDANILCLGARVLDMDRLLETLRAWLSTPYEGGRHAARLEKIRKLER